MSTDHRPYFIGIVLPPELSDHVSSFKWQLHKEIDHALMPLVPHITLLHPPSLKGVAPGDLLPQIRKHATSYLPLTVSLETVEAFDQTVLYIRARSPELEALQGELVKLLPAEAREIYYRRGFIPHVTLAQVRAPHTLNIEGLSQRVSQEIPLPHKFSVNCVSYFVHTGPREYRVDSIYIKTPDPEN